MRLTLFILLLFACDMFHVYARSVISQKEYRILLLLNTGRSMKEYWSDQETKYQLCSRIIVTLMDSMYTINDQVAFGLRAYGQQYPAIANVCNDSRQEVGFSKDNRAQVHLRLLDLKPKGIPSLAYAIKDATENNFTDTANYYYSLLIITDSSSYCSDNLCGLTKDLLNEKVNFKTYAITIGNKQNAKKYDCLGESLPISAEEDITPVIQYIISNYRRFLPAQNFGVTTYAKKRVDETDPSAQSRTKKDSGVKKDIILRDSIRTMINEYPESESVVIRKNSNIKTEEGTGNYGWLQFKNDYNDSLFIYRQRNGSKQSWEKALSIEGTSGYIITLKEGQYKVVFGNNEKIFRIVKSMITDIRLD